MGLKNLLAYKIFMEVCISCVSLLKQTYVYLIRGTISLIIDHFYDKKIGIETSAPYNFKDNFSLFSDAQMYRPTPYFRLKMMVDYLKLNQEDVFIDFGCGRGRVTSFMATQKIKKVIGVELTKELADIARKNYDKLKLKNTPVEIIQADAATVNIQNGTVFFIFNPFGWMTLEKVVNNIKSSLITNPRKIRIAYYDPRCRNLLDNQDWLIPEEEIDNTDIYTWCNKYPKKE